MTMRANYFNLLLVLLMGVLPIQLQASESDKNVILYTPYTKIAVPPGESVNYSIDVINNYDVVKNVNLSVKGLPRGWNYELKAGTWTISELAVLPHDKKNVSLKVDIPLKSTKELTVSRLLPRDLENSPSRSRSPNKEPTKPILPRINPTCKGTPNPRLPSTPR